MAKKVHATPRSERAEMWVYGDKDAGVDPAEGVQTVIGVG